MTIIIIIIITIIWNGFCLTLFVCGLIDTCESSCCSQTTAKWEHYKDVTPSSDRASEVRSS